MIPKYNSIRNDLNTLSSLVLDATRHPEDPNKVIEIKLPAYSGPLNDSFFSDNAIMCCFSESFYPDLNNAEIEKMIIKNFQTRLLPATGNSSVKSTNTCIAGIDIESFKNHSLSGKLYLKVIRIYIKSPTRLPNDTSKGFTLQDLGIWSQDTSNRRMKGLSILKSDVVKFLYGPR